MQKKEYLKKLDAHMAKIAADLKQIKDPKAKEIRDGLIKLGADVVCTDTGIVMQTAIDVARDLLTRVYEVSKHNVGPIQEIIENTVKGDPFYGDIIEKKTKTYDKHGKEIK